MWAPKLQRLEQAWSEVLQGERYKMFPARLVCLSALLLALVSTAFGQDAYPSKPITMVNPFPPGGVDDIVGRPLAGLMEKTLKQPVIFVNRTGAGGAVGSGYVAHAA